MKTPLSILLTSGVCAAQLAFSASLVPNGGFEEGADADEVMRNVLANCKKVEDDCEIYL